MESRLVHGESEQGPQSPSQSVIRPFVVSNVQWSSVHWWSFRGRTLSSSESGPRRPYGERCKSTSRPLGPRQKTSVCIASVVGPLESTKLCEVRKASQKVHQGSARGPQRDRSSLSHNSDIKSIVRPFRSKSGLKKIVHAPSEVRPRQSQQSPQPVRSSPSTSRNSIVVYAKSAVRPNSPKEQKSACIDRRPNKVRSGSMKVHACAVGRAGPHRVFGPWAVRLGL